MTPADISPVDLVWALAIAGWIIALIPEDWLD